MHKLITPLLLCLSLQAAVYENKLEFGFKTTAYDYTERDNSDAILDTEESNFLDINGLYVDFDYKLENYQTEDSDVLYYLNLKADYTGGDTDYTGSLLEPTAECTGYPCLKSTTYNEFFNLEVNLKRKTQYNNKSTYLSAGLGYYQWYRELSSIQEETYYWFYAVIGIGGDITIYKDWLLGLDLSAQLAFDPKMDADFSETTSTNSLNETYSLGTVYTYKIAVPLTIPINDQFNFTTKLEYEFSSYGKSNTITTQDYYKTGLNGSFLEPKSQSKNFNFYAGLQFLF